MKKRAGFKFIAELDDDEKFVSILEFQGKIIVCSTKRVYRLRGNTLCPVKFKAPCEEGGVG